MMDNYTMIGLIVGCAVGGALFLIIFIIVCLVLREGWQESKRRNRINRYRATSPDGSYYPPPSSRGDVIGIAYNDPSMYAADVRPVRPESLWRRSIRRVQSAFGLPSAPPGSDGGGGGRASTHAHGGGGKGLYHSPLNSNSSGSSKKQMLSPADEVELRYPPQPPHHHGHGSVGSRQSVGRTEPPAAGAKTALPRTALPTVADDRAGVVAGGGGGGGYSNMAAPYSERYYELLRPAGVLADGQVLYFCRTQDYYDLSDCFDIVGKKDGGWLVKPADGMPPPPQQPSFASVHRPPRRTAAEPPLVGRSHQPPAATDDADRRRYASAYGLTGRAAADTDRRRFASDYDLHRSGALTGNGLAGGFGAAAARQAPSHSNGSHAAHAARHGSGGGGRRGEQAAVIATPFGPARRMNDQYLSGTALAATAAAAAAAIDSPDGEFEGAHTPPPLPKQDYRPAKPPRAMLTEVTVEVDGVGVGGAASRRQAAKEQPEAAVHIAPAATVGGPKREIGFGIVATPVASTVPAATAATQPTSSGGASGRRPSAAATMAAAAADGASSAAAVDAQPPLSSRSAKDADSYGKRRGKRTPSSKSSSGGRGGGGGSRKAAASPESPVLVSARVLHDSNVSLAAAAVARDPPAGGQSQKQTQQKLVRPSSFADLPDTGLQIPRAELEVAIAVAPPTPPPPPSEDASASVRDAGSEPPQGRGLSLKSAAILAAMPELNTVGSKDTVSTIKSYSRHIAEEFKFLDKYEGSTGTPEPL